MQLSFTLTLIMPTPQPSRTWVHQHCRRRAVLHVGAQPSAPLLQWIVQSVETNLATGRFQRVAASRAASRPLTLSAYIDRVTLHATREYARIHALENGDPLAWERLRALLLQRALRLMQRLRPHSASANEASNAAQQVCLIVFETRYPCDVPFDAWATTILNRLILARYTRSPDLLDRQTTKSLEQPTRADDPDGNQTSELIADPQSLAPFEKIENQTLLLDAIDRLTSHTQRQVIVQTFLEEMDDAQIARRLGKSRQAVYNLRARALARLKEILTESGRKKTA
jgi:RNA polymerase sigma factor (sigma-70 family)